MLGTFCAAYYLLARVCLPWFSGYFNVLQPQEQLYVRYARMRDQILLEIDIRHYFYLDKYYLVRDTVISSRG
jgi:hypothetical protein